MTTEEQIRANEETALRIALKRARKKRSKWCRRVDMIDDRLKCLLFAKWASEDAAKQKEEAK